MLFQLFIYIFVAFFTSKILLRLHNQTVRIDQTDISRLNELQQLSETLPQQESEQKQEPSETEDNVTKAEETTTQKEDNVTKAEETTTQKEEPVQTKTSENEKTQTQPDCLVNQIDLTKENELVSNSENQENAIGTIEMVENNCVAAQSQPSEHGEKEMIEGSIERPSNVGPDM